MGFLSFSLNYYSTELEKLESVTASGESVYHARQLLKMLDDLVDEGYAELSDTLEDCCRGVSRLRSYLKANEAQPFPICRKTADESALCYSDQETELMCAVSELIECAGEQDAVSGDPFIPELLRFCEWIGYEKDTAYIFLLRDTLIPFVWFHSKGREHIYPWLLGRKTLAVLSGNKYMDDEIRSGIIRALESGCCGSFRGFCDFTLKDIRNTLSRYPQMERELADLLHSIKENRILVIESGCSGTFPMLLKSLDDRVDIRMYTTYPYLRQIYADRIYTTRYEDNRLFETLWSQDLYLRFSSFKDGLFYVKKCLHEEVQEQSYGEVRTVLDSRGDQLQQISP